MDTIGILSVKGKTKSIRTESIKIAFPLPFASGSLWEVSPADSSVVIVHRPIAKNADSGKFQVVKLRSLTDTVFARQYSYGPRAVPVEFVDSILAGYIGFWSRAIPRAEAEKLARDSIPIPAYQPPVSHLAVGRDGTIWLQRERLGRANVHWVVLGDGGKILKRVEAPSGMTGAAATPIT